MPPAAALAAEVPIAAGRDEIRVELGASSAPAAAQLQRDTTTGASRAARRYRRRTSCPRCRPAASPCQAAGRQPRPRCLAGPGSRWAPSAHMGAGNRSDRRRPRPQLAAPAGQPAQPPAAAGWAPAQRRGRADLAQPDASVWRLQLDAEQLAGLVELRGVQFRAGRGGRGACAAQPPSLPRQDADTMSARATELLDREGGASFPALDIVVTTSSSRAAPGRLELEARVPPRPGAPPPPPRPHRDPRLTPRCTAGQLGCPRPAAPHRAGAATRHRRRRQTAGPPGSARHAARRQGQHERPHQLGRLALAFGLPQPRRRAQAARLGHLPEGRAGRRAPARRAEPAILPRRLLLDFRDVFADGFVFDGVTADVHLANGVARSDNIRIRGVQAAVLVDGSSSDLAARNPGAARRRARDQCRWRLAGLCRHQPRRGADHLPGPARLQPPHGGRQHAREFHITGTWSEGPKVERVERIPEAVPRSCARCLGPHAFNTASAP